MVFHILEENPLINSISYGIQSNNRRLDLMILWNNTLSQKYEIFNDDFSLSTFEKYVRVRIMTNLQ